jgi:hypothetical protein
VSYRLLIVGLLALMLAGSACNGEDSANTSTVSPSTVSVSTSGEPSTTSTLSTPSPTTGTTQATTTTIDKIAATKQAIAAAAVQSRQDYLYAVQNYDAPDALTVLGRTAAANSPALQLGVDNMNNLRSHGWKVRPNPTIPSSLTVESDVDLLDGPPATRAQLTVCEIGSGIIYEPNAAPDGSDTIVNDEINARRSRVTMVLEGGSWKVYSGEELGTWNGEATCPPG